MPYNHYYFKWPKYFKSYSITKDNIRIKWQDAKILHFKGRVCAEYPKIIAAVF